MSDDPTPGWMPKEQVEARRLAAERARQANERVEQEAKHQRAIIEEWKQKHATEYEKSAQRIADQMIRDVARRLTVPTRWKYQHRTYQFDVIVDPKQECLLIDDVKSNPFRKSSLSGAVLVWDPKLEGRYPNSAVQPSWPLNAWKTSSHCAECAPGQPRLSDYIMPYYLSDGDYLNYKRGVMLRYQEHPFLLKTNLVAFALQQDLFL